MNITDIMALLPLIMLSATAIAVMGVTACCRHYQRVVITTLLGLMLSFGAIAVAARYAPRQVSALLIVDPFALFYTGLLIASGFIIVLFAYGYLKKQRGIPGEFFILLVLALLGSAVLAASTHFASFFLGLELLSISLYALLSYLRANPLNIEAGIKYLVLSSVSSAFLLFGMALIYADMGTMAFAGIAAHASSSGLTSTLTLVGLGLIVIGFGFKLALVPFHFWTPDVYQGSPAPATAFIATISKGSVFALLLRFFTLIHAQQDFTLVALFSALAIASMVVGNLLALRQNNVKRLLAYSSISNMGYLLVAFLASGPWAATAVTFFLVAYLTTILGAFGIVGVLSTQRRDADAIEEYRGLAWRHPWLAGAFTLMLLSLAGIPLTSGFVGKFFVLFAGVQSGLWLLVVILVLNSAVGLYYYLRVIVVMFTHAEEHPTPPTPLPAMLWTDGLALTIVTLAILWLGIFPNAVLRVIQAVTAGL